MKVLRQLSKLNRSDRRVCVIEGVLIAFNLAATLSLLSGETLASKYSAAVAGGVTGIAIAVTISDIKRRIEIAEYLENRNREWETQFSKK